MLLTEVDQQLGSAVYVSRVRYHPFHHHQRHPGITFHASHSHETGTRSMKPVRSAPPRETVEVGFRFWFSRGFAVHRDMLSEE